MSNAWETFPSLGDNSSNELLIPHTTSGMYPRETSTSFLVWVLLQLQLITQLIDLSKGDSAQTYLYLRLLLLILVLEKGAFKHIIDENSSTDSCGFDDGICCVLSKQFSSAGSYLSTHRTESLFKFS